MKISLSLKLLTGLLFVTTMSSQVIAAPGDRAARQERRAERRAEHRANQMQQRNARQARLEVRREARNERRNVRQARLEARREARNERRDVRWENRQARRDVRWENRQARRDVRWENRQARRDLRRDIRAENQFVNLRPRTVYRPRAQDNRRVVLRQQRNDRRIQVAANNVRFRNWTERRRYLNQNMRRFRQIARLNALQQQRLDAQMRAAYLAYRRNNWNGPYNWNVYSEPQFLDYLQDYQPSLLERILSYLGIGTGVGIGIDNSYSPDWSIERDQLAQNMYRIHQLRLEGRITPFEEQQLLSQMRAEFMAYHNHNWNGEYGWSEYSDPGFMDYLYNRRPSLLSTIRNYIGM